MYNFKSIHSNKTVALNVTATKTDIDKEITYQVLEIVTEITIGKTTPTEKDYNFIRSYFKYIVKQITDGCVFITFVDSNGKPCSLPISTFITEADFESGLAAFIAEATEFAICETIDEEYKISVIAIHSDTSTVTIAVVITDNK